jgi:hypothetical protein
MKCNQSEEETKWRGAIKQKKTAVRSNQIEENQQREAIRQKKFIKERHSNIREIIS